MGETLGAEVATGETPIMGGKGRKQHWGRQWETLGGGEPPPPLRMENEMGGSLMEWVGRGRELWEWGV